MATLLDILGDIGYLLDTPRALLTGAALNLRDLLTGEDRFKGYRASGRELLEQLGVLERNRPGLDWGDVAGFGLELLADPLNLVFGLGIPKLSKMAKTARLQKAAGWMPRSVAKKTIIRESPSLAESLRDVASAASRKATVGRWTFDPRDILPQEVAKFLDHQSAVAALTSPSRKALKGSLRRIVNSELVKDRDEIAQLLKLAHSPEGTGAGYVAGRTLAIAKGVDPKLPIGKALRMAEAGKAEKAADVLVKRAVDKVADFYYKGWKKAPPGTLYHGTPVDWEHVPRALEQLAPGSQRAIEIAGERYYPAAARPNPAWPQATDAGFFGRGTYFTGDPSRARPYAHPRSGTVFELESTGGWVPQALRPRNVAGLAERQTLDLADILPKGYNLQAPQLRNVQGRTVVRPLDPAVLERFVDVRNPATLIYPPTPYLGRLVRSPGTPPWRSLGRRPDIPESEADILREMAENIASRISGAQRSDRAIAQGVTSEMLRRGHEAIMQPQSKYLTEMAPAVHGLGKQAPTVAPSELIAELAVYRPQDIYYPYVANPEPWMPGVWGALGAYEALRPTHALMSRR